jgi:Zn-dependent protease
MSLFAPPPRTRFDLNFKFAGFPVRVHPLFWLIAILLGGVSGGITQLLIWVVAVFVSILLHELGHSLMMRVYGIDSFIVLHMAGGLAISSSSRRSELNWIEQILISFAGPAAGFIFAAIILAAAALSGGVITFNSVFGVIPVPMAFIPSANFLVNSIIRILLWINIFWGLINLFPVYPLDGGNISRHIFVRFDPWNGVVNSLWLSVVTGVILAVAGFVFLRSTYMAFLFGLLALQSYQILQGRGGGMF